MYIVTPTYRVRGSDYKDLQFAVVKWNDYLSRKVKRLHTHLMFGQRGEFDDAYKICAFDYAPTLIAEILEDDAMELVEQWVDAEGENVYEQIQSGFVVGVETMPDGFPMWDKIGKDVSTIEVFKDGFKWVVYEKHTEWIWETAKIELEKEW